MKYTIKFKNDKENSDVIENLWHKGYVYNWDKPILNSHYLTIDEERKLYWYEDIEDAEYWLKQNPIYKPGDLFQIKSDLKDFDQDEFPGITGEMLDMAGKIVTLKEITDEGYFIFEEDKMEYVYLEKWVEPIENFIKFKNGNYIIII